MTATTKLYYQFPKAVKFRSTVLGCEQTEKGYLITLAETLFYPEGGGQPCDLGTIGGVEITEVHEREGVIFHTASDSIEVGTSVEGEIDGHRRRDLTQQHSGEHILSGIICARHGLNNVGFHIGADAVTIDFDGELTEEELSEAENIANEAIWQDFEPEIFFPDPKELVQLEYRSKKELTGEVRIVRFGEYDTCACCGTHVEHTGEIGMVKILGAEHYKKGQRIELVCGERALREFAKRNAELKRSAAMLSAKPSELTARLTTALAERDETKRRLSSALDRLWDAKAAEVELESDVVLVEDGLTMDDARRLSMAVAKRARAVAVVSPTQTGILCTIASETVDVRAVGKAIFAEFNGHGGGNAKLVSGNLSGDKQVVKAFILSELRKI